MEKEEKKTRKVSPVVAIVPLIVGEVRVLLVKVCVAAIAASVSLAVLGIVINLVLPAS